jgi:hypothetical protein
VLYFALRGSDTGSPVTPMTEAPSERF